MAMSLTRQVASRCAAVAITLIAVLFAATIVGGESAYAAEGSLSAGTVSGESAQSNKADVPLYRMYNYFSGEHHYTTDKNERNVLPSHGWRYEGVAWMVSNTGTKIYRLYNPYSGLHHYTTDENERNVLSSQYGWRYEGVLGCSASSDQKLVYRLYNPSNGYHLFTQDENEKNVLPRSYGWRYEGVAWYGGAVPSDFKDDMTPWTAHISGDVALDTELDKILFGHKSLWSCYQYLSNMPYREGNRFYSNPHFLPDSTTIPYAKEMATKGSGNCYRYASLFCWLARGLGYDAKVVSGWIPSYSVGRAPHGWVEVYSNGKTYVCDPELNHAMPGHNFYMIPYSSAPVSYGSW